MMGLFIGFISIALHPSTFASGGPECGGRDNSQFLTGSFRDSNPDNAKIICALFGDGSGGTNKTAYTSGRGTNTCSTGSLSITGISPGTDQLPVTLANNTIYVLESGSHIISATRNMGSCSAIVGKGTVEIKANYTTDTRLLMSSSKGNWILDNLLLNRNRGVASTTSMDVVYAVSSPSISFNAIQAYSGYVGIYTNVSPYPSISNSQTYSNLGQGIVLQNSLYGNVNNVKSYNNTSIGIYFYGGSHFGTLNNAQSYNNGAYGISFYTSNSGTINNVQSYNNSNNGIYFYSSSFGTLNNAQSYNNSNYGIYVNGSPNTTINNTQIYNTAGYGIYFYASSGGTVNNTQIYNNNNVGTFIDSNSSNTTINNTQIYNNNNHGVYITSGDNNKINNSRFYNNAGYGINILTASTNNQYYGDNKTFGNTSGGILIVNNFSTGTDGAGVGRSNGKLDFSPSLSRDYFTNPLNNTGKYLLNRSGSFTSLRARIATFTNTSGMQYSYGSGILLQIQPVYNNGTTLIASGSYDPSDYIGGTTPKVIGDLLGLSIYNMSTNIITGIANSPATLYNIFGDLSSFRYGVTSNTSTGIIFSGGMATGKIITQIYDPINYFATHFQRIATIDNVKPTATIAYTYTSTGTLAVLTGVSEIIIITNNGGGSGYFFTGPNYRFTFTFQDIAGNTGSTMAWGWNNDNFINADFRSNNPSSGEIINALYGDGSGGIDKTAYTKYWTGNLCLPASMTVNFLTAGVNTLTITPAANTIYVLGSGSYTNAGQINSQGNCVALVGTGNVTHQTTAGGQTANILLNTRWNNIIDNVKFDTVYNGTGGAHLYNAYGIYINAGGNHTINNVKTFNAQTAGLYINAGSVNNLINNLEAFNNKSNNIIITTSHRNIIQNSQAYGSMYPGIVIGSNSQNNKLNNVQVFNNGEGIDISASSGTILNNIQVYNNQGYGAIYIEAGSTGTIINNSALYNNAQYAFYIRNGSNNIVLNNVSIYNNGQARYSDNDTGQTGNKFYGTINIFGNTTNGFGTKISTGGAEYANVGWTTGTINTAGTMNCSLASQPDGFLYHPTDTGCLFRGVNASLGTSPNGLSYIYGTGLYTQVQPVQFTGGGIGYDVLDYNTGYTIAQVNSGSSVGYLKFKNATYFTDTGNVEVYMGYTVSGATYTLSGDFIGSPITNTLSGYSKVVYISLTTTTGTKYISAIYSGGGYSRNFSTRIDYIGPISDPTVSKFFSYTSRYTDNRERNVCDPRNMVISQLTPGVNKLSNAPTANTIYILNSGDYIITAQVQPPFCGAWAGSGKVTLYTSGFMSYTNIVPSYNNSIMDNLRIDGENNGIGGKHAKNAVGFYPVYSANLTFNDIRTYNNSTYASYVWFDRNLTFNNINGYNNASYGINFAGSTNILINNSNFYNNGSYAMQAGQDNGNFAINNTLMSNHAAYGISFGNYNSINVFNNIQSYDNQYGFATNAIRTKLNNIRAYTNSSNAMSANAATRYYGTNTVFNNFGNTIYGTTGFLEYASLGWSTGTTSTTGIMSCDRVANPRANNGTMLQTGSLCDTKLFINSRTGYITDGILYGENIAPQIQPVMISNQEIVASHLPYNTNKFIAETDPLILIEISSQRSGQRINTTSPTLTGYLRQGYARLSGTVVTITGIASPITGVSNANGVRSIPITGLNQGANLIKIQSSDTVGRMMETSLILNGDTISSTLAFTGTTPTDNLWINNNSFSPQIDIIEPALSQFTRNRNRSGYSLYDSGLVVMYNFDKLSTLSETDGLIKDASQYANNASGYSGVIWTGNGKRGGAYTFGNGAYIRTSLATVPTNGYTISAWIKINQLGREQHIADFTQHQFFISAANRLSSIVNPGLSAIGSTTVSQDTRYFVTMTRDIAQTKIYLNGIIEATANTGGLTPTNPLTIGQYYGLGIYGFSGQIDEVRIYNRVLSTGDIQMLYMTNLAKYNTGSWLFSANMSGITDGTYLYTGQVRDAASNLSQLSRTINIDTQTPTQTILSSPVSGTYLNTGTAQLRRNIPLDTGGISGYQWQLSTSSSFSSIYLSGTTSATGINILGLSDTTYYRRIYAFDNVGYTGAWSTGWNFVVDTTAPIITFTGATPADNTWITNNTFTGQVDITETYFNQFIRRRSGVNYSIYDSGLLLGYNFNKIASLNETNTIIKDYSKYANDTSGYGTATWTGNGKRGGAYDLNGTDGAIRIPGVPPTTFSMSLRFYRDSFGADGYETLIGGPIAFELESKNAAINTPVLQLFSRGGGTGAYQTGRWNHIVFIRTPSYSKLFLNGNLLIAGTAGGNPPAGNYWIGAWNTSTQQNFKGKVDEFMMYNRALSTGEVQMLYMTNLAKYDTNRRSFTAILSGVIDGSYGYSGTAIDFANNTANTGATINIDTQAPTQTMLSSPVSGTYLNTGTTELRRNIPLDTGGISGYKWQVSTSSSFASMYLSGTTTNTGINILGLSETTYYRRVYAFDNAGNTGARSTGGNFTIDTTAPSNGGFTINSGASITNNTNIWITNVTGIDSWTPIQMRFSHDGITRSGRNALTSTTGRTLDTNNGTGNIYMQLADAGGNITGDFLQSIYVDAMPPSIDISPASTTVRAMVVVSITGSDIGLGLENIYYKALLGSGDCPSTGYIVYPTAFMLPGIPDQTVTRKVCAYGIDLAGNTGQMMSGVYILDSQPPQGNFIINSGALWTSTPYVRIQNTFNDAINMRFTNEAGNRGSRELYDTTKPWTIDTGAGDGIKTIYAQFNDSVNNILDTGVQIIYDTLPPEIYTGYIAQGTTGENNGKIYFAGTLNLRGNVYDAGVGLSGATCEYSFGTGRSSAGYGIGYCEIVTAPQTDFQVQFRAQDQIGNLGTGITSDLYYADNDPPINGQFTINNNDTYTNSQSVTLNITQPQDLGIGGIEIGYGNSAGPTNWTTLGSSFLHTLSRGQGQKNVYVGFRDALHNTTTDYMHSIVLDTVAPLLPRESSRSQTQDDGKDSSIVALQEDNQGNTYALGRFNGRMWIGNIQVQTNANQELFITKHNKAGELIWFKQTQSNNRINPTSLVIENNGDIVIGGYFQGDSVFGTASVSSVGYGDNGFFSTLDANGNRKRVKAITNNDGGTNQIFAITTDENNNIYIAGNNTTNGYLDGQVAISTTPSTEIFILKTDSTGNRVRTTQTQNSSNVDQINDIHYDNNGNIYMVGYTDGFVDFGATTLSSPGGAPEAIIAKIDINGNRIRATQTTDNNESVFKTISINTNGEIYIGGYFAGNETIGTDKLDASNGAYEGLLTQIDSNGNRIRATQTQTTVNAKINDIESKNTGEIMVAGNFYGQGNRGSSTLDSNSDDKGFIAKVSSDGSRIQAQSPSGNRSNYNSITVNTQDTIHIGGDFYGQIQRGNTGRESHGATTLFIGTITSPSVSINQDEEYTAYSKVNLDIICGNDNRLRHDQERISFGESGFPRQWIEYCIPGTLKQSTRDLSSTYPLTQGQKTIAIQYKDEGDNTSKVYSKNFIYDTIAPILSYTQLSVNERGVSTRDATSISGQMSIQEDNLQKFIRSTESGYASIYDPSLHIMYNFDQQTQLGESDTLIKDLSLTKNDGIPKGSTPTSEGKRGGAEQFGRDNTTNQYSYLESANMVSNTDTNNFTFSAWIYPQGNGGLSSCATLMKMGNGAGQKPYYNIKLCAGNSIQTEFFDGYGVSQDIANLSNPFNANRREYVTITYDYATQFMTYYINGTQQQKSWIANLIPGVRDQLIIGATDKDTYGFDGRIDEVRFYNRALTAQEIALQYQTNLSKVNTGSWMLSFWPDFSTGLSQHIFGYSEDGAGNGEWSEGKTLIRDSTPPQIAILQPTGAWISQNFPVEFDINETNFAKNFNYTISGNTHTIYDSGISLFFNFDDLSALPRNDTEKLVNLALRRNTSTLYNQVIHTPAWLATGYILRDSNVYLAPGTGHERGSYYFDGETGSFILAENSPDLSEFSINLRVNMDVNSKNIQYIISKGTGRYLYTDAGNNQVKLSYEGTEYVLDTIGNYFKNKERNFMSLRLSNGGNLDYRINAAKINISLPITNISGNILIGGLIQHSGENMRGYIDNLNLYNQAIGDEQIDAIQTGGNFVARQIAKDWGGEFCLSFDSNIAQHAPYTIASQHTTLSQGNGNGYFFDGGINSRLILQDLPQSDNFSIDSRVNINVDSKNIQYIISKGTGRYLYTDAGNAQLKLNYEGTEYIIDTVGHYFQNNTRNNIALMIDKANNRVQVYVNNDLADTINTSIQDIPGDIMFGDLRGNDGNEMIGYLDNIVIAKTIRNANEINTLTTNDINTDTYYSTGIQVALPLETPLEDPVILGNNTILSSGDGKRGGAGYFDGQTDTHLQISNLPTLNKLSVSLRVKTNIQSKGNQNIISQGDDRNIFTDTGTNTLILEYKGTRYTIDTIGNYFVNNQRNFIAWTIDNTGNIKTYVNNHLTNTITQTPLASTQDIYVGDRLGDDTREMQGYIDDLSIFSETLSATDIASLFSTGNKSYATMPQAQVLINFDPPAVTNPHLYTIQSNNIQANTDNGNRRGDKNYSYYFDGKPDTQITIGNVPTWKAFSVSLWIYPIIQKSSQTIISKGTGWKIFADATDGKIKINYFGTEYRIAPLLNKTRYQIGVSLNAEGVLSTYMQGSISNRYQLNTISCPGDLILGDSINNDTDEWVGSIDEISIFSGIISEDNMHDMMNKGSIQAIAYPQAEIIFDIGEPSFVDLSLSPHPLINKNTLLSTGAGIYHEAMYFNGTTTAVASIIDNSISKEIGVSLRVKTDPGIVPRQDIISKGNNRGIYTRDDKNVYLGYMNKEYRMCGLLIANIPTEIAISIQSGGTITAYCNGRPEQIYKGVFVGEPAPIEGNILLGSENHGYSFSGYIDELRRYNHSISSGEVNLLTNSNLQKYARYDTGQALYIPKRDFSTVEIAPSFVEGISICLSGNVQDLGDLTATTGICLVTDTLPPSGSFTINTGATYTNTSAVVVDFSNITGANNVWLGNTGYTEKYYNPLPTATGRTLLTGDGLKRVYGAFSDLAGNMYYTNDTIILDTQGPILTSSGIGYFTINTGNTATSNPNILLRINTFTDNRTPIQIAYGTSSSPTNRTGYNQYVSFNIGTANGWRTIYIRAKDGGGNISNTYTGSILIDTQAPYSGSFTINGNSGATASTGITLNISCAIDSGIGGVQVAYGTSTTLSNWTGCISSLPYTLTATQGAQTIYMQFADSLGNTGLIISNTINYDTTAPILTFTGATPADNAWRSGLLMTGQIDIAELNLGQFIRNRNGSAYSLYDSGVVAMYNFNNAEINTNSESVVNGGTGNQTDFIDSNGDGSADNWDILNNGSPTITESIVTGNGFYGNAQRVQVDTVNGATYAKLYQNIAGLTAFKKYTLKIKWRSNTDIDIGIGTNSGYYIKNIGTAPSNAKYIEKDIITDTPSMVVFQMNNPTTGSWIEIDEVSITDKRIEDISLYNNHAEILNSPTWTSNGKRGGGYTFSSGAYLRTTLNTAPITGYTISAWIKLSQINREQHIADFTNNQFYVSSTNRLSTSPRSTAIGTTALSSNTRYFVTLTRDQTKTTLYLNGRSESTGSAGTNPGNQMTIGHIYSLVGNYSLSGTLDELQVYNRALSSGEVQMLYWSNLSKSGANWSFIMNRTPTNINGSFSYSGWAQDILNNTGVTATRTVNIDTTGPTVTTGMIFSGTTGSNGGNTYYRGVLGLKASVSDTGAGISGGTCEYTTGASWLPAIYTASTCQITGVSFSGTINVQFRVRDTVGNLGTGASTTYLYDGLAPSGGSFMINTGALYTNKTGVLLSVTCPTDTGIGGVQIAYGNTSAPTNRTTCTGNISHTTTVGDALKTIYVRFRDAFTNTTSELTKTITLDTTLPTLTFTESTPASGAFVGNPSSIGQLDITELNLGQFTRYQSGKVYPIYDSGLVLMMNFDNISALGETTGFAKDVSQYANTGTIYGGVSWTSNGKRNGGASFNGVDGYININNNTGINISGTITLAMRVKPTTCPTTSSLTMFHKERQYDISLRNGCTVSYADSSNRSFASFGNINIGVTAGVWSYIVLTKDTNNFVSLYLNGNYKTGKTFGGTITQTTNNLLIGNYLNDIRYFNGTLDEMRIYNRAISSGEVALQYNSSLNKYATNKWMFTTIRSGLTSTIIYSGRAQDLAGNSSGSENRTLQYSPGTIPTPQLLSPINGTYTNTGKLLRSIGVSTGITISGYTWQISTNTGFSAIILSGRSTTTGVITSGLPDTTLYRRVKAHDTNNNSGSRATYQSFILDTTQPIIVFTGASPANGISITGNDLTVQMDIIETGAGLNQFTYTRDNTPYTLYDSGILLMYNFDKVTALGENASTLKDMSLYNNASTIAGATRTGNGKRGGAYLFNGYGWYISVGNQPTNTLTEGTISAWIRRDKLLQGYQMIFTDDSSAWELCFNTNNLQFYTNNNAIQQIGNTNTGRQFITATFSETNNSRKLYVNGQEVVSDTYNGSIVSSPHRIGSRHSAYSFSGAIDEFKLYNHSLSASEVQQAYYSNLAKYDTGKWLFTDYKQCIVSNGTHNFSGSATDAVINKNTALRQVNNIIPAYNPSAPGSFSIGSTQASSSSTSISGQFDNYFQFADRQGNTGWTTTIQLPLEMRGQNFGLTISGTNIAFKAIGIDTLQGRATNNIVISGGLNTYNTFSAPRTYIVRDGSNREFTCPAGVYGNKPWVKVNIPARQSTDTYTGIVTFDMIQ